MVNYCPSCGSEVEADTSFCSECGKALDEDSSKPSDTKPKESGQSSEQSDEENAITVGQIAVAAIVIVGLIMVASALPADDNPDQGTNAAVDDQGSSNTDGSGSQDGGDTQEVYSMNEAFVVDGIEYQVTDVRETPVIGSSSFTATEADGVYLIVSVSMTNVQDEATTISERPITLVDEQDRRHQPSSDGMFAYEDTIGVFGEEVNPGVTFDGAVIFDIPEDHGGVWLVVSGDEHHYVELNIDTQGGPAPN